MIRELLREVLTQWIMTRSALDVVTVGVRGKYVSERDRIPVRELLSRVQAEEGREPLESLYAAIAQFWYHGSLQGDYRLKDEETSRSSDASDRRLPTFAQRSVVRSGSLACRAVRLG